MIALAFAARRHGAKLRLKPRCRGNASSALRVTGRPRPQPGESGQVAAPQLRSERMRRLTLGGFTPRDRAFRPLPVRLRPGSSALLELPGLNMWLRSKPRSLPTLAGKPPSPGAIESLPLQRRRAPLESADRPIVFAPLQGKGARAPARSRGQAAVPARNARRIPAVLALVGGGCKPRMWLRPKPIRCGHGP